MRGHQQEMWYQIWMRGSEATEDGFVWVFLIRGDTVWIVLAYWMDRIVSDGSYSIIWIVFGNTGFYALAGYWIDGTN